MCIRDRSIEKERKRQEVGKKLYEYIEDENLKKRSDLIFALPMSVSYGVGSEIESINKQYYYHFEEGYFQFFILQLHYSMKKYDKKAMQKTIDGLERTVCAELSDICTDYEICIENNKCYVCLLYTSFTDRRSKGFYISERIFINGNGRKYKKERKRDTWKQRKDYLLMQA